SWIFILSRHLAPLYCCSWYFPCTIHDYQSGYRCLTRFLCKPRGALRRFLPPFRCGRCGVGRKEQRRLDEEVRSGYQLKVGEIDPQLIVKKELSDDELVDYGIQLAQLASVAKSNGKKVHYLHFAKDFLMEALSRQQENIGCRGINDENMEQQEVLDLDSSIDAADSLRAHLAAVLVTLGEDPQVVREKL
ncbi:hypothetical protein FOZ63_017258, partial [Perkinsus olseni]